MSGSAARGGGAMRATTKAMGLAATVFVLLLGVAPAQASGQQAVPERGDSDAWRQVDAGTYHTCGVKWSGRLYCWGSDAAGQLGDGGTNTDHTTPVEVAGGGRIWTSVSAGNFHTCATDWKSRLFCWGSDFYGQLGNGGANTDLGAPLEVGAPVGASGDRMLWTAVSAGYEHTCARMNTGRLYCWGNDGSGRLGNDAAVANQTLPVEVAGAATDWTSVSAGTFHSCATTRDGRLYCWGLDSAGQLGNGTPLAEQHTPVEVAGVGSRWADVGAGGSSHTCARTREGRLYCWGWDVHGQLGDDAVPADKASPVEVAGGARWTDVSVGSWHTCARKVTSPFGDTQLQCWGLDEKGAIGDDAPLVNRFTPVPVALPGVIVVAVSAGTYHTCALTLFDRPRSSTRVGRMSSTCWGFNSNGQLGDGGTTDQPTPVAVVG